jgi:hypothetical protein
MPKSCKPRPTIYFAASSRSREGVSSGLQRHRTTEAPDHRGPLRTRHLATGRRRAGAAAVVRVSAHRGRLCPTKRFGRSTIGSAGLYGSPALHLRA